MNRVENYFSISLLITTEMASFRTFTEVLNFIIILLIAAHFAQASDENRVYKENTQGYEKNACPAIADCENAPFKETNFTALTRSHINFEAACDNIYYFGDQDKSWYDAAAECCRRNMRLATFEDFDEQACFYEKVYKNSLKKTRADSNLWVGASDEWDKGKYQWCGPDKEVVVSSSLRPAESFQLGSENSEHCVNIRPGVFGYLALNTQPCFTPMKFICKLAKYKSFGCPETVCVAEESKQQFVEENVKLMKESLSKFRKVEKHPRILTACNKTFLFTLENFPWKDSIKECCKYGLKPLKINSQEDLDCLVNENKNEFGPFWTSGLNDDLSDSSQGEVAWCGTDKRMRVEKNKMWAKNQPENIEKFRCLALSLERNQANLNGLQDTDCDADLPVICESF